LFAANITLKTIQQLRDIALLNNSSQSYRALLAIWDHTVLPSTRHKWTHPAEPQPDRL